jgi:pilus assembly protein Flp/PilA
MAFFEREKGQGLLEYGLIIIIVAVLVIVLLFLLGDRLGLIYSNVVDIV